jgi:hypothetical protein
MRTKINPYILFSPLLVLYLIMILLLKSNSLTDDEPLYLFFAHNLLHGFYSPEYPNINLWVGPGYPAFLAFLLALKIPYIIIKLFNGILLYFSIILMYKTMCIYIKNKNAIIFSFLLGLYLPFFIELPKIMTESVTYFVISIISFLICTLFNSQKIKISKIILISLFLAYLSLIKVIFGYVYLFSIILFGILALITMKKKIFISFVIFSFALIFTFPYLIYTYSLTGKLFYWSNAGGDQLYWKSNPNATEYGDWHSFTFEGEQHNNPKLINNHIAFRDYLANFNSIEKDEILKKKAIENIKLKPSKFLKNWISGIGTMLFASPFSYKIQKPEHLLIAIPNSFIFVFSILFLIPTFRLIISKKIPFGIIFLLTTMCIYFLGSSLLAVYWRQFNPIVPIICLWFAYVFDKFINTNFTNKIQNNK